MPPEAEDADATDRKRVGFTASTNEPNDGDAKVGSSSMFLCRGLSGKQLRPSLSSKGESAYFGLATQEVSYHIPTHQDDMEFVTVHHGEDTWQSRVIEWLHSTKVEFALMGLLLLDVLILFVELYLSAAYPPCHIVDNTALNCCPATSVSSSHAEGGGHSDHENAGDKEEGARWRWLSGGDDDHHEELCEAPYVTFTTSPAGCDEHKNEAVHMAEEVLFYFTILILVTFFVELCIVMAALTPRIFFKQAFYVLDLFVVTVSLGLELSFHLVDQEALADLSGVLVLARVWRFLRIGHGLVEATHEYTAMKHHTLEHYASECEKLLLDHGITLPKDGPMFTSNKPQKKLSVPQAIQEETSDEIVEEDISPDHSHDGQ